MFGEYRGNGELHTEVDTRLPESYISFPPSLIFPASLASNFIAYGEGMAASTFSKLMHKSGRSRPVISKVRVVAVTVVEVTVVEVTVVEVVRVLVLDVVGTVDVVLDVVKVVVVDVLDVVLVQLWME